MRRAVCQRVSWAVVNIVRTLCVVRRFALSSKSLGEMILNIVDSFNTDQQLQQVKLRNPVCFYRAKLCCLLLSVWRLSVCLSRWCIVSRRLKIVKLLSQFGSPIIIVFDPQRCYLIPWPSAGAQSTRGWGKFSTEIAVYLGNGAR